MTQLSCCRQGSGSRIPAEECLEGETQAQGIPRESYFPWNCFRLKCLREAVLGSCTCLWPPCGHVQLWPWLAAWTWVWCDRRVAAEVASTDCLQLNPEMCVLQLCLKPTVPSQSCLGVQKMLWGKHDFQGEDHPLQRTHRKQAEKGVLGAEWVSSNKSTCLRGEVLRPRGLRAEMAPAGW